MAVKNQAHVLWAGLTGRRPPRSVGEIVDAVGGTRAAARLAGVAQRTMQKWRKEEADAVGSVRGMVRAMGGRQQAASAAGVSPRTIRDWERKERRGEALGPRQQARAGRLQDAAARAHAAKVEHRPGIAKMRQDVVNDAAARQRAMNPRRAARIANSGARVRMHAHVSVIATDPLNPDRRNRENMDVELRGPVLDETVNEWMNGGDADAVLGKMSEAFTQHYLHHDPNAEHAGPQGGGGARWTFNSIKSMQISQATPGAPNTFRYRD
ncbi:hypothetical protein GCM10009801_73250 [Streptomyces albiaxialis]|uniref:Terminal protein n=1 Tax=Streptomyces albiaxialis TaxID=329523 RepID=A0ABN2WXI6_9ACTN